MAGTNPRDCAKRAPRKGKKPAKPFFLPETAEEDFFSRLHLPFGLTSREIKEFLVLFVALFLWFEFGVDYLNPFLQSNMILSYSIFLITYSYVVFTFILGLGDPVKQFRFFFAFMIAQLIGDVLFFPYLVSKFSCTVTSNALANFSSDVFICQLLPSSLNAHIKYWLTYPVSITIGFLLARAVVGRRRFNEIQQQLL